MNPWLIGLGAAVVVVGLVLALAGPKLWQALGKVFQPELDNSPQQPRPEYRPPASDLDQRPARALSPEEIRNQEALDAFAKLKALEIYFGKIGSKEGVDAICQAGQCMFKPPAVAGLSSVPGGEQNHNG